MNAFVATGITITGGPSNLLAEILDVTPPDMTREAIPSWHQGSTQKTFIPAKLIEYGELQVDVAFAGTLPTLDTTPGTYTITFPNSGASTIVFTGFITKFAPKAPIENRATASITIKVASKP